MPGDHEGWFREELFKEFLYAQNRLLELMDLIQTDARKLRETWVEYQSLRSQLDLKTRPPNKN